MQSKAATVDAYLKELPEDRRAGITAVRRVILKNLDKGYTEGMSYGMIGYAVPHSIYPAGYHCDPTKPVPFAGLASQKNHMSVYLCTLYGHPTEEQWFRTAWEKSIKAGRAKKLDMGASCIRFKKLEDIDLDLIGEAIRRMPVRQFITYYENAIRGMNKNTTQRRESHKIKPSRTKTRQRVKKKTAAKKQARSRR